MLSKFTLISLILCVGSCQGTAQALSMSGFAYTTKFSNQDYREDKANVAVNIGHRYRQFAISSQFATTEHNSSIRRLHLDIQVHKKVQLRFGRFSRVLGFYNDVSDSPSSSGMAVLPQAPYNDNFLTSSFSTMDGLAIQYRHRNNAGKAFFEASIGKLEVAEQEFVQNKTFDTYFDHMDIESKNNNYSLFTRLENKHVTFLAEYSNYKLGWTKNREPTNPFEFYIQSQALPVALTGTVSRIGTKAWDLLGVNISTERFKLNSVLGKTGGYYIMIDKYIKPDYKVYIGFTEAKSSTSQSQDTFMGISKNMDKFFVITELHITKGYAWTSGDVESATSLAITIGYRF